MAKTVKKAKLVELSLTVVGFKYRMKRHEIEQLADYVDDTGGLTVQLEPEPTNEVDPKAIKVIVHDQSRNLFNGRHIGYIRRPANESLADWLKQGGKVKVAVLDNVWPEEGEGDLNLSLLKPPI